MFGGTRVVASLGEVPVVDEPLTRPTTCAQYWERQAQFHDEESFAAARAYQPRADDVFVVTPSKSGTTWTQQIVHQLRTGGSMDFDNINDVVPWLEMALLLGVHVDDPQVADPRAFKTHSPLHQVPNGGRYVVVLRDPQDALLSLHRFFDGSFIEAGAIDLETFTSGIFVPKSDLNGHVAAVWPRRNDPDVLLLCYEDMKDDLPSAVRRIATFIGIELDDELLDVVVRQSSIGFMKQHEDKFEDSLLFEAFRGPMRLPPVAQLSKVRTGQVGESHEHVTDAIRRDLDELWRGGAGATTGLPSYAALRAAITNNPRSAERTRP